jgi:peptidyl-tRNA hydrolase
MQQRRTVTTSTRSGTLSPGTHITMTIKQMIMAVIGVGVVVLGYSAIIYNQVTAKTDIAAINSKVDTAVTATATVSKDQDTKRDALGEKFIASQEKIVEKVTQLNLQLVQTQDEAKQSNATLAKISDQLGNLSLAAGHPSRR